MSNPPLTNPRNLKLPSQQTLLGPQAQKGVLRVRKLRLNLGARKKRN